MDQSDSSSRTTRKLCPVFFGICFILSFNIMSFRTMSGSSALPLGNDMVSRLVGVVAFVAVALLSRRGVSAIGKRLPVWLWAACTTAGVGLTMLSGILQPIEPGIAAGVCLAGLFMSQGGYCVLFLAWIELLSRMSMDYALLYYVIGRILSAAFRDFLVFVGGPLIHIASVALPFFAAAFFIVGVKKLPELPYAQGEVVSARWRVPWRPMALFAVFSLVSHLSIRLSHTSLSPAMIGSVVGSLFVFAVVATRFKSFSLVNMQKIALPMLLASLLCTMLGPAYGQAGLFLAWAANDIFLAFVYALLFDMSYRNGVNALWLFGLTQASISGGQFIANSLGDYIWELGLGNQVIAASIVIVTLAFLFFQTERDAQTAWGIREEIQPEGGNPSRDRVPPAEKPQLSAETLQNRCSALSRRFDLTRREEQVLFLRLQGASNREIEESLVITSNTVKSHVRHIYRKLGVTDLEGARSLIEQ